MLKRMLITDRRGRSTWVPDIVVWLGGGSPPRRAYGAALVVAPSSVRVAAVYVVTSGPTELRLDLTDPMAFVDELLRVNSEPAIRAA